MPLSIWIKEAQLNVGYMSKPLMCTLLAFLAIWHISMVRKKTDFRSSVKTDGSLSAILKVKLNNPN